MEQIKKGEPAAAVEAGPKVFAPRVCPPSPLSNKVGTPLRHGDGISPLNSRPSDAFLFPPGDAPKVGSDARPLPLGPAGANTSSEPPVAAASPRRPARRPAPPPAGDVVPPGAPARSPNAPAQFQDRDCHRHQRRGIPPNLGKHGRLSGFPSQAGRAWGLLLGTGTSACTPNCIVHHAILHSPTL